VEDNAGITDREFQSLGTPGHSLGRYILAPRLRDAGRFSGLPDGIDRPGVVYAAPVPTDGQTRPIERFGPDSLDVLDRAMTAHWRFLHVRGRRPGGTETANPNTLTRYAYNTYGIRRILDDLDARDVAGARVLLVTGYETPIEELLDSERIAEVLVVDVSSGGCAVVAEKYSAHPRADQLRLERVDVSCLEPEFQMVEAGTLVAAAAEAKTLPTYAGLGHFRRIATGAHFVPLPMESNSFDAVHIPFVLGSLYLGPTVVAIDRLLSDAGGEARDCSAFVGVETLASPVAAEASMAVLGFVLSEFRRITQPGGLIVVNMWARPQPEDPDRIRISDTIVSPEALDRTMAGFIRLFSGNPQPTLPQTLGHILETRR